jgi:hypothetical protein
MFSLTTCSVRRSFVHRFPVFALVALVTSLALAGFPTRIQAAGTFVVNRFIDGIDRNVGDGLCDASPADGNQCSLRAAIMEANAQPGDNTITLPAGTYMLVIPGKNEDASAAGDLDVHDTLTINGAGPGKTFIDADGLDSVFQIHNAAAGFSLNRMTLLNGDFSGLRAIGTTVLLNQTVVRDNKIGIEIDGSTLMLTDTTVRNNTAGGMVATGGSTVRLLRTTVSDNTADFGAGLHLTATTTTLVNSIVAHNTAGFDGGGIYQSGGTLGIYSSSIFANVAGLYSNADLLKAGTGGGLYVEPGASATIKNSILGDNGYWISFTETGEKFTPQECTGTLLSEGYNLVEQQCQLSGDTATVIVHKDARFVTTKVNYPNSTSFYLYSTYALRGDSPAIDMANPNGCTDQNGIALATDRRGVTRQVNGNGANGNTARCDFGAYEYTGPLLSSLSPKTITMGTAGFTITVEGTRFTQASVVRWNGENRPTTFVSSTQLTVQLPAGDRAQAGKAVVTVFTPGLTGGTSNVKPFTVTVP